MLRYIERTRTDESVGKTLARKVIDSFVLIAIDDKEPNRTNLAVYTEDFETPFMNATKEYIKSNLRRILSEGNEESVLLEKVRKVVDAEELHVAPYLLSTDPKDFVWKCVREAITDQVLGSDPLTVLRCALVVYRSEVRIDQVG